MRNFFIMFFYLASLMMPSICSAQPIKKQLLNEDGGFKWYRLEQGEFMGAESESGKTLIPLSSKFCYVQVYQGRFLAEIKGVGVGIYDLNGNELLSPTKGYDIGTTSFNQKEVFGTYKYYKIEKDRKKGYCDLSGNIIIPCVYDEIAFRDDEKFIGYIAVEKDGKHGAYDLNGKEIVPCIYNSLFYDSYPGDECFKYKGANGYISLNMRLKGLSSESESSKPADRQATSQTSSSTEDIEDYGYSKSHGKILKRTSELQGTIRVTQERYEDGYYSIFLMDKCKVCGGTGRIGSNLCNAGCAMGFLTLLTYYDPNGNEVERSGNMVTQNNSYSGGSFGGSYSDNSSGSNSSSSVYTKCTSCNGTGICTSCNGKGYKFNSYSGHDDICPNCRGKRSCPICYGRKKL